MASRPRFSSAIQVNDRKIRYGCQQIAKSVMFFKSARKLKALQINLKDTQNRAAYGFKPGLLECKVRQGKHRLVLTKFRLIFRLFALFSCRGYMYSVEWCVIVNGLERMHVLSKYFLGRTEEKCISRSPGQDLSPGSQEYGGGVPKFSYK